MRLRAERVAEYVGNGWHAEIVQFDREKYVTLHTDAYLTRREVARLSAALLDIAKAMET